MQIEIYEPGNGTRYILGYHSLEKSQTEILGCQYPVLLVSWLNRREKGVNGSVYFFSRYAHPDYVREKLGGSRADAEVLSNYINELLERVLLVNTGYEKIPVRHLSL